MVKVDLEIHDSKVQQIEHQENLLKVQMEEFTIWLQLKTIADIGIIGLPNAGKSSLLAAITNANPKISNYEFTTLNPNLGVAHMMIKKLLLQIFLD